MDDVYWSKYDTCWRCGALAGQRCRFLRHPTKCRWQACPQRKRR